MTGIQHNFLRYYNKNTSNKRKKINLNSTKTIVPKRTSSGSESTTHKEKIFVNHVSDK